MDKLWVDKYRPKTLKQLDYNFNISDILERLAHSNDFPHLLFYGPNGAGKKTRVMAFLNEVFGQGVYKLKSEFRSFKISPTSSTKVECNIISSNYHLDITPSEVENRDKVVVQNLIKEVAQNNQINLKDQKEFKVIIINEVDSLTKEAQAGLRRTMEKYISKCRLILICENIGRVIAPIRSRCLCIRIPAPQQEDISQILKKISKKENIAISETNCIQISSNCERNIRRAILQMQTYKIQNQKLTENLKLHIPEWQQAIRFIAENIKNEQSPNKIKDLRENVYNLLTNCIPPQLILKYMLYDILIYLNPEKQYQAIHWAAHYENRMQLGSKPIFHIEAFIARIMLIYKQSMMELNEELFLLGLN